MPATARTIDVIMPCYAECAWIVIKLTCKDGKKAMRIAILTHIKHPVRQPFSGGLEAFTYDVTIALKRRGHDVTLFARSNSAPELDSIAILDDQHLANIPSRCNNADFFQDYLKEHVAYMQCMQKIDRHRFDVIFNNSLHYVPLMMASLMETPMLTVLHTPPFFELTNAISAISATPSAATSAGTAMRFATVSGANARNWKKWVPECTVIQNGIDLSQWEAISTPTARHAIWYGRLVPEKGAHLAIDAARLAGMSIEIAGECTNTAYFETEIAPRLSDTAVYIGHLDRAHLVSRVQNATVCLVTPCWEEPFGLVVVEALACGTPVAAFARGAIPDLLTPLTGVIAAPDDAFALAKAALAAAKLSRTDCRRAAEALWDQTRMITGYEHLLEKTAAHRTAVDA